LLVDAFLISAVAKSGNYRDLAYALVLPAICFAPFAFASLEVDETEIRMLNYGIVSKRARFAEIGYSVATALAEKKWPLSLTICGQNGDRELMTIRLKLWRHEDVKWLLGLAELKLRE
jgi:hypothetical protein